MSKISLHNFAPVPAEWHTNISADYDALEKLVATFQRAMNGEGTAQVTLQNASGQENLWIVRCSDPRPVS